MVKMMLRTKLLRVGKIYVNNRLNVRYWVVKRGGELESCELQAAKRLTRA